MSWTAKLRHALAVRADSWANTLTGVGSALGKTNLRFTLSGEEFLSLVDCENLYNFDGICARIVDAVPKHALRQGFTVSTGVAEEETAILDAMQALQVVARTRLAWTWGRGFGGGALVMGIDDGRALDQPVDESRIRAVRWLWDVDRRDLYPFTWVTDPDSPDFTQPALYRLTRMGGTTSQSVTVHASRVIRFEGPAPTRRRRLQLQGWGDSVLQRVYAEIQAARGAFAASGVLLQEASQGVLKIKDLMSMMASDTDDTMKRRLELMDQGRSVARALLLDADGESFERVEVGSLTGVTEVMDRMVNMVAAVSGIPVTVLMGQAPAGLNATGESDIRSWYDEVGSEREQTLRPQMQRLLRIVLLSKEGPTGGKIPDGWKIVFPSLWQMTPAEEVDLRSKQATADVAYITSQVLTPEEVATSRFRREGWSSDTSIDLDARQAAMEADATGEGTDAPGTDHAEGAAGIIAKVASRELPRDAGVALLEQSMGMAPDAAEAAMGEAGRSFFTAPDPAAVDELAALRAENAKLKASNQGHKAFTARVIQKAKDGGLELGAFTAQAPTETAEGDELAPGDVVAVPVEDSVRSVRADGADGVAVVLLPADLAATVPSQIALGDLHVTLAFLGPAAGMPADAFEVITRAVIAWADRTAPITGTLGGIGRFPTGPDGDPVYVPFDSETIADDRTVLVAALAGAGFAPAQGHGFVPHLTVAYVAPGDPTPAPMAATPMKFDRVSVWFGGSQRDVMLTGEK